jgi:hypothetical protein
MRIQYVPLLHVQRDLYRLPRGMERFREYLRTMVNETGDNVALPPLVAMNPMAREHVPALIDEYLAQNADDVAAAAVAEAQAALADVPGEFSLAVVACDDLMGGWTNRYATEFAMRCGNTSRDGKRAQERSKWITVQVWSSERASVAQLRVEILIAAFRVAYQITHGPARTVREMLAQEGHCMHGAGCQWPVLDRDEIEYTREAIRPHLEVEDMPIASRASSETWRQGHSASPASA